MQKTKQAPKKTGKKSTTSKATQHHKSPLKKTPTSRTKKSAASTLSSDWKSFSQHILKDYALPLSRMIGTKLTTLQRRFT